MVLYTEEDQDREEIRRRRRFTEEDIRELTLDDDGEDDFRGRNQDDEIRRVKLKTYNFKKPQFMKKLTNTYYKKSKTSEKVNILHK